MAIDLERTGIESNDPILNDLQGNILKAHGREHSIFVLLRFKAGAAELARAWLQEFAREHVTSARQQEERSAQYRASGAELASGLFCNISISAAGYAALGWPTDLIPRDETTRYNAGMIGRKGVLGDPDSSKLEGPYQGGVHLLILLASDDLEEASAAAAQAMQSAAAVADPVWSEYGVRWYNAAGEDIEPFGNVDGVSQPLFFDRHLKRAGRQARWDPSAPLSLVLAPDPYGDGEASLGSFLIFRKLEQDVAAWQLAVQTVAERAGISPELAGAFSIGRFADGTPVISQGTSGGSVPPGNDFDYSGDLTAGRCPFHAHIRKVNPRGDTVRETEGVITPQSERKHRIARRGVPYGKPEDIGTKPVGLLFTAYQADIGTQFEFQQGSWANGVQFVEQGVGLDPLIGQGSMVTGQRWPRAWGDASNKAEVTMGGFIKPRGGDYFFTPSVSFLHNLAGRVPAPQP